MQYPKIVQNALLELERWKGADEESPQGGALIRGYWREVGQPFPGVRVPWSAAFLVALDKDLPRTGYHMGYLQQITLKRARPWARLAKGEALKEGDIVVQPRGQGATVPSEAEINVGLALPTHGDVVVEVAGGKIWVVGGNVQNSVRIRSFPHTVLELPFFAAVRKVDAAKEVAPTLPGVA